MANMRKSTADIVREYGPFPGAKSVAGVTYDGQKVWFAAGDKLNAFDPESGKVLRSIDVAAHAGTAFDGQHLFQLAEDRILKIDPNTGQVLATIPAPGGGSDSGLTWAEGTLWVGQYRDPQDPPGRSRNGCNSAHDRIQPLRHGGHLARRRALARHLGKRTERIEAARSGHRRGPGETRHASRSDYFGTRVRRWRSILLRRRNQREGEDSPPAQARLRNGLDFG